MVMPSVTESPYATSLRAFLAAPAAAPALASLAAASVPAAEPAFAFDALGLDVSADRIPAASPALAPASAAGSPKDKPRQHEKFQGKAEIVSISGSKKRASLEQQRQLELLELAVQATTKIIESFEPLRAKVRSRVRLAERLKFWGQLLTTVLSSTVVGSVVTGNSRAGIIFGILTLVASLFGVAANNLLGSDSKFVEEFGEASAKFEAAKQLRDRLLLYEKRPELFTDIDDRLKEADGLRVYLTECLAKWY